MSKYDNYQKIEEIRNYYNDEDYEAAAELAESVDWKRVKSWDALAMMTDAYENLEEYEYARDMAILAYNRNLGGKKLVYRLTDLLIKTGELDEAEEVFNEYCHMSKNSPDSYILEYRLLRAKNAPDKELIRVLEEFKEVGPDERYMYRLAELYAKNGEDEKCAAICDNIALWFKDGDFAEGAVKLKKRVGGELSPEQEKLYAEAKVKEEDLLKTGKVDFKGQVDRGTDAAVQADEKVGVGAASAAVGGAAGGAAGKLKSFVKNVFNDEDFDEDEFEKETAGTDFMPGAAAGAAGAAAAAAAAGTIAAGAQTGKEDLKAAEAEEALAGAAGKDTAEVDKHDIDSKIKENLSAEVKEELDTESALRGDGVYEGEKQIDGQLNMNDWMTDVREQKYGGQSTKEYSKTELERMLEEKDEKSQAYDRLMAEQKKLAKESGTPFNEASAKAKVEQQLAIDAARRDLDIRTGKGAAKQESANAAIAAGAAQAADVRPQEETVLGAVLEAAGAEAVREAARPQSDPANRMLRIESAVLSLLGARLSEKISARGREVPEDVVNAAALLVKYISGEYEEINKAKALTGDGADKKENIAAERPKAAGDKESSTTTAGAAAAAAGAATVAGAAGAAGILHEKAKKAKEIFAGGAVADDVREETAKKPEAKEESKGKAAEPKVQPQVHKTTKAEADAIREIKATKDDKAKLVQGAAAASKEAVKEDVKFGTVEDIKPDIKEDVKEEIEDGIKTDVSSAADVASPQLNEELKQEIKEKVKKETEESLQLNRKDRNTGKTPDLRKMRLNKVTAEDVEANLTDDEAALAQRITSGDHAADIITARITGQLNTAEVEKALAESEKTDINITDEDTFADTAHIDKKMLREIIESSDGDEDSEGKSTRRFDTTAKQDTAQLDNVLREDLPKGKREKIKSMFDEYYDMPEIDGQIEEYIASLPTEITRDDSRNGNIIIAGAESVDKTGLAKTIAKAVNISYPKRKKKVIRTTGENLNQYGFARSADKLRGTFLVIENVGLIRPEVLAEIVDVMRKDTDRMIVIAEDTDAGIESFLNSNPALPKLFNHRINMRPFTTEELVEIAKDLAGQKGFKVTDEGALALYLEIDELRAQEPKVTIEDMDALTDDAIAHAKKRIKRETGVSPKRLDEGMSLLTNEDFRY